MPHSQWTAYGQDGILTSDNGKLVGLHGRLHCDESTVSIAYRLEALCLLSIYGIVKVWSSDWKRWELSLSKDKISVDHGIFPLFWKTWNLGSIGDKITVD